MEDNTKFTIETYDLEEAQMYLRAESMRCQIETFYNDVLRPIRKYGEISEQQSELLEEIIKKTGEHFNGLE